MLHTITINAGNYEGRGVEYTNVLFDQVRRNLPEGFEGDFTVFTDDITQEYAPGIIVRPLPAPWLKGWWHKLSMFDPDLFPKGDRILWLDLDTLVVGPLDDIANYSGNFAILRDFYRPHGFGSAIMAWAAGTHADIWDIYNIEGCPSEDPNGDQGFIEKVVRRADLWQNILKDQIVSFKKHARLGIPKGARVVVFHGLPRPHQVETSWVHQVWKVGGGTSAEMVVEANVSRETISANIRHALGRKDARWLGFDAAQEGEVLVCAGGPSLKDNLDSIRAHIARGAELWTVNGSFQYLKSCDLVPHAHIMLDARKENIGFVPPLGHPAERIYSSQCDPSVLDAAGRKLTMYHPYFEGVEDITGKGADAKGAFVGGGTTAGLKAVAIAYARGCRKIHMYGFDSSYRDNENHAYPQPLNDGEKIIEVTIPHKGTFKCAPWMVTQAEDFQNLAEELTAAGVELFIHGDGLLPELASMAEPSRCTAEQRANAILNRLEKVQSPVVAEIGVFTGELSKRLLARRPDMKLYMIDSWGGNTAQPFIESDDYHADLSPEDQEECFQTAKAMTSFAQDRAIIIRDLSSNAVNKIDDESLDLVFIDADHSYEGCKSDIENYYRKVKPGGIISGHDYDMPNQKFGPMVKMAVDEFVEAQGLDLHLGDNHTWFAEKPGADA